MKALLIAEKPDLMRHVQDAYKNSDIKDVIDFASFHGHIMGLKTPEEYNEIWKKWSRETLPILPERLQYKPVDVKSFKMLVEKIKNGGYDYLINCCDPDREGQLIFYSFYNSIGCKIPVKRMWHSDLTEKELIRAIKEAEDDSCSRLKHLTQASYLRAEMDWLVGMNASRAATLNRNMLTRIGRVMTPTFKILADRELEIRRFKSVTKYGIEAMYESGFKGEYNIVNNEKLEAYRGDLNDVDPIISKFNNSLKTSKNAIISKIEAKQNKTESPGLPSLADIQMQANKMFGYKLEDTIALIQSLYEKQFVSYPRTDCQFITAAVAESFEDTLENLSDFYDISKISSETINAVRHNKKIVNDEKITGHYALIPTLKKCNVSSLSEKEQNIYSLICRRFISIFLDPNETMNITVTANHNDNILVSKFSKVTKPGWKILFKDEDDKKDLIPSGLKEGLPLPIKEFVKAEHTSEPPARYTDATLLKAMINAGNLIEDKELAKVIKGDKSVKDSGGIGTPATRAAIVEKIVSAVKMNGKEVFLAQRKKNKFFVSDEGLILAKDLGNNKVTSPELTAIWEDKFKKVERGELSYSQVQKEIRDYTVQVATEMLSFKVNERTTPNQKYEPSITKNGCPICNGKIKSSAKGYYCENFKGMSGDGCKFFISNTIAGAKLGDADIDALLSGKETKLKKMTSKSGKEFKAKLKMNKDHKIEFIF